MSPSGRPWVLGCTLALSLTPALAGAQSESRTYTDSRGKKIVFPLGDASFADEVVSFENGKPPARDKRWSNPSSALGLPNYDYKRIDPRNPSNLVLGCAGTLVVRFNDNALVDVPGPDLYVFEVGPAVEPLALAISTDATTWTEAGRISGGTASRYRARRETWRALSIRQGQRSEARVWRSVSRRRYRRDRRDRLRVPDCARCFGAVRVQQG